jgi:small subunit ribosomal protein S20
MPIKKSGFKRLRQDKKKHTRNKSAVSEIRTLTKQARTLIAAKSRDEADTLLKKLESKMDRAARRNMVKKSTMSRSISRLRKQWAAIKK